MVFCLFVLFSSFYPFFPLLSEGETFFLLFKPLTYFSNLRTNRMGLKKFDYRNHIQREIAHSTPTVQRKRNGKTRAPFF